MSLLEHLPTHPGELITRWLDDARNVCGETNWNVMMLATVSGAGRPGVRAVLLKEHDGAQCTFHFFTNYQSRKARDMDANQRVACAMYWDTLERQIRIEGRVSKLSAGASDAYFATRPRESQIGAWASEQSEPIENYNELKQRMRRIDEQYAGRDIPRPPHWGGYCIAADVLEFWHGKPGRVHERVQYVRESGGGNTWTRRWLNP